VRRGAVFKIGYSVDIFMDQAKDFLQSEDWFRFQESVGHEIIRITDDGFSVGGIVHVLPIVGRYLYTPRWPQARNKEQGARSKETQRLLAAARRLGSGWVRVELETEEALVRTKE